MGVTFVVVARIPRAGIERFQRYEDAVLPLIVEHGGRLERRLRSAAGDVEVHVLSFAAPESLDAYLDDPRRAAAPRAARGLGRRARAARGRRHPYGVNFTVITSPSRIG